MVIFTKSVPLVSIKQVLTEHEKLIGNYCVSDFVWKYEFIRIFLFDNLQIFIIIIKNTIIILYLTNKILKFFI